MPRTWWPAPSTHCWASGSRSRAAPRRGPRSSLTTARRLPSLAAHGDHTYREFLRVPALSLGLFAVPPGHRGTQQPHQQDEVDVVLGGRAVLETGGTSTPVSAGSVAYVPARAPHRFVEISEDLRGLVLFAPPDDVRL